jgi:triacylglycerol lipase
MKPLPDPSERDLIPPDMDYVYFEGCEQHPLEPEQASYSPANAWWLAESSFLVYCHPGFARMACRLAGLDHFHFFEATGTECMLCWNREVAIVAFRGTELKSMSSLHEIRTDLNATPVPFDGGGMVHCGFLKGLDEVWGGEDGLQAMLARLLDEDPDRPLLMTGHSLGGALAALCFARTPQARALYTFGAPRVGDPDFVALLEGRSVWRIENARDPVPLVPPDMPALSFCFGDLGVLKFLNWDCSVQDRRPAFVLEDHKARYRDAKDTLDAKLKEMALCLAPTKKGFEASKQVYKEIEQHTRLTKQEWRLHMQSFFREFGLNVNDHQPIYYAIKCWNALLGQGSGVSSQGSGVRGEDERAEDVRPEGEQDAPP